MSCLVLSWPPISHWCGRGNRIAPICVSVPLSAPSGLNHLAYEYKIWLGCSWTICLTSLMVKVIGQGYQVGKYVTFRHFSPLFWLTRCTALTFNVTPILGPNLQIQSSIQANNRISIRQPLGSSCPINSYSCDIIHMQRFYNVFSPLCHKWNEMKWNLYYTNCSEELVLHTMVIQSTMRKRNYFTPLWNTTRRSSCNSCIVQPRQ